MLLAAFDRDRIRPGREGGDRRGRQDHDVDVREELTLLVDQALTDPLGVDVVRGEDGLASPEQLCDEWMQLARVVAQQRAVILGGVGRRDHPHDRLRAGEVREVDVPEVCAGLLEQFERAVDGGPDLGVDTLRGLTPGYADREPVDAALELGQQLPSDSRPVARDRREEECNVATVRAIGPT